MVLCLCLSSFPSHSSIPLEMNSEIDPSVLSVLPLVLPPIANLQPPPPPIMPLPSSSNNGQDPFAPVPTMAPVDPMPMQSTVPGSPEQAPAGVTELMKEPQANTGYILFVCICVWKCCKLICKLGLFVNGLLVLTSLQSGPIFKLVFPFSAQIESNLKRGQMV